jgi:hypothetical protein
MLYKEWCKGGKAMQADYLGSMRYQRLRLK